MHPYPVIGGLGNPTALQDSLKAAGAKKSSHHYSCSPSALLHVKVSWNPVGSEAFTGPRYNESRLQPDSTCGAALLAPMCEGVWNGNTGIRLRVSLGSAHSVGSCSSTSYGQAGCSCNRGSAEDRLVPPMLVVGTRISNKCRYVRWAKGEVGVLRQTLAFLKEQRR